MKKMKLVCAVTACFVAAVSFGQSKITVTKRAPVTKAVKQSLAFKQFVVADAKSSDGKKFAESDIIKTISGNSMTVGEYLKKINSVEQEINQKGFTLRNLNPTSSNLMYKPVLFDNTKLASLNTDINKSVKPLLSLQANNDKIFIHASSTSSTIRISSIQQINPALFGKLKASFGGKSLQPETIEKTYDIKNLLKPLTGKIDSLMSSEVDFSLVNAALVVSSHAEPPATGTDDLFSATNSVYKVTANFGASVKASMGLPISLTIPLATMNGEFISPSNKTQKLSRKVVVNLLGRSLFNKTSAVNSEALNEQDSQELDISELINSAPLNTTDFMDWIPSIGFNTDVSTMGSVGCMYKTDMTRTNVDAYIGPTYSVRLRVAASYGLKDVAEGGIEGIVTLLKGGLGFGGNAGLDYDGTRWNLINKAYVEATLQALQGEVDFFVRFPDLSNWSCLGPCIKKVTLPIFQTPVAFTLNGTLLQDDNGKSLNW
jgi:hypothetical protein